MNTLRTIKPLYSGEPKDMRPVDTQVMTQCLRIGHDSQCSSRKRFSMKSVCVEMLLYPMRS